MNKQEFEAITEMSGLITDVQFKQIEWEYMQSGLSKEAFCVYWMRANLGININPKNYRPVMGKCVMFRRYK